MMYRAKPGLVIGFHGCGVSVRTAVVLNETNLFPSKNDYDWLGHGIYFWENNRHRAAPIVQPATLGAVIDMGYCLDLMDSECLNLIRTSYEKLATAYDNFG